jgi:hypothetical protein
MRRKDKQITDKKENAMKSRGYFFNFQARMLGDGGAKN